ncbi:MAG: chemotaxis protein CheW [Moorella humiferrea]|uniref:Chemotaxis protein CheW n=1 Tax=Neomoorella humiferrea TaxID=676965 RepID=A0A2T0AYT3_9FIRM|nr:chemotaxis protein CheW [Moorella humiferrea]MBE3573327.1 chemotaxis protein CheW [Moorella humiferrea]PRR76175.1 Chemotaxis protein CheW [Moorella humiferrea]
MANGTAAEVQLVVFQLAGETYGVDINYVQEIIRMQNITPIPRTPAFIEGVINLRGRIIPVIDLHKRFHLPQGEVTNNTRIMVVEMGRVTVGMIVDSVSEVLRLPVASIEPPPSMISGIDVAYLKGVGKWNERLIILLDLERVLQESEQRQLEQGMAAGVDGQ